MAVHKCMLLLCLATHYCSIYFCLIAEKRFLHDLRYSTQFSQLWMNDTTHICHLTNILSPPIRHPTSMLPFHKNHLRLALCLIALSHISIRAPIFGKHPILHSMFFLLSIFVLSAHSLWSHTKTVHPLIYFTWHINWFNDFKLIFLQSYVFYSLFSFPIFFYTSLRLCPWLNNVHDPT